MYPETYARLGALLSDTGANNLCKRGPLAFIVCGVRLQPELHVYVFNSVSAAACKHGAQTLRISFRFQNNDVWQFCRLRGDANLKLSFFCAGTSFTGSLSTSGCLLVQDSSHPTCFGSPLLANCATERMLNRL